jgi:capsular exopolysaccharide synthesis family protein
MSAYDRFGRARESETLLGMLDAFRRHWLIVIGVVLACIAVMVVRYERAAKVYAATASVTFQSGTLSDAALQVTPTVNADPVREAATNVLIAHSPEVASAVVRELKLKSPPSELLGLVSVEAAENAEVLHIIAKTGDPRYAASLANAFAEQYIAFKANSQLSSIETARNEIQHQIEALPAGSTGRASLEQSLQRLGQLRAAAYGGANIIGRATPPTEPSGTKLSTTIIIGLLLGLALAFTIIFLFESLDRRIKSIDEFERIYRMPTLAGVPQDGFRTKFVSRRSEGLEPYRILRSALDFAAVTQPLNTLLVTSAVSGEGKTTVAIDLAQVIALAGRRVTLVELDLRRPTFSQHFKLETSTGLTTALTRPETVKELIVSPIPELPNFLVLPAGRIPPNPSELLGSQNLADILEALAADDSMVVIDTPPVNPVADTQVLLNCPAVDGAIMVARSEMTTRDAARRARSILDRHTIKPIGMVITGLRDGGRYGYGAYESKTSPTGDGIEPVTVSSAAVDADRRSLSRPRGGLARWLSRV